jgi:peptidoglycan endopeptidase LytE
MRSPSASTAALSRLAVLPAAALAVVVTSHLTDSQPNSTGTTGVSVPVAAVRTLPTDGPAPHAETAHQSALRHQFYAGVQRARTEATLVRFYAGVQHDRTAAAQHRPAAPVATSTPAATATPSSTSNLNWSALAACEASGNPGAVSSGGYMGLYQFDQQTWESVGGSGTPTAASPAEQTLRAEALYAQRGSSPWPVCGSRLFS